MRDLAAEEDFDVLVVDLDPVRIERMTEFGADGVVADLSDAETVSKAVKGASPSQSCSVRSREASSALTLLSTSSLQLAAAVCSS